MAYRIEHTGRNQVSVLAHGKHGVVTREGDEWVGRLDTLTLFKIKACTVEHRGTTNYQDRYCRSLAGDCFTRPDSHVHLAKYCHAMHGPRAALTMAAMLGSFKPRKI